MKWFKIEILGLILVIVSTALLLFSPESLSELYTAIMAQVKPIVVDIFLTGEVGIAIIVSVIFGRILERLGFTDGLIWIFVPIMKWLRINPSVIIPSVYNILGDINAAGKIAGPILMRAGATVHEQKIAIATMIQSPQSFATFIVGLVALTAFGIKALPLVLLSIFAPLIIVPWLLSRTIYQDTRKVEMQELPRFTPTTRFSSTVFNSAREGAQLLFLVIIPAVAAVFFFIGVLEFAGVWKPIESALSSLLLFLQIEPTSGIMSILASPTLAMAQIVDLGNVAPALVVGSFVLANSGLPLSVVFGQVPVTWAEATILNERQAIEAAVVGTVIRLITAVILALFLTPLLV